MTGYNNETETFLLRAGQIPAVGEKANEGYKAGSWDVTPDNKTHISKDITYTYTYAKIETRTIRFEPGEEGVGTMKSVEVSLNSLYTLPKCEFASKSNEEFYGWMVRNESTKTEKMYSEGSSFQVTDDCTLISTFGPQGDDQKPERTVEAEEKERHTAN